MWPGSRSRVWWLPFRVDLLRIIYDGLHSDCLHRYGLLIIDLIKVLRYGTIEAYQVNHAAQRSRTCWREGTPCRCVAGAALQGGEFASKSARFISDCRDPAHLSTWPGSRACSLAQVLYVPLRPECRAVASTGSLALRAARRRTRECVWPSSFRALEPLSMHE